MEHWRKIALIALSLCILLVSCANPAPEGGPVTITFACRDHQRDQYRSLARTFHKGHPSIDIQIRSIGEITGNPSGVVTTSDPIKIVSAADTYVGYAGDIGNDPPQNVFLDLSELAANDERFDRGDLCSRSRR